MDRGSGAGGRVDVAVSRCCRVAHKIDEVCRSFGNGGQEAVLRIDGGRREERGMRARRALLLPTPQTNCLNKGASPWSNG